MQQNPFRSLPKGLLTNLTSVQYVACCLLLAQQQERCTRARVRASFLVSAACLRVSRVGEHRTSTPRTIANLPPLVGASFLGEVSFAYLPTHPPARAKCASYVRAGNKQFALSK